jgi:serine/threonine-protein kinase
MGEVFHAIDEQLGRPVAVKLMLPSGGDSSSAERFRREARAAARLSDPHLVAVYDFGQQGDQFFLVMELVEGHTVAAELAEHGPLPKDRAIDIVEQSAAGLAVAHDQGVVHRDVKPGNLLMTPDGMVKVADFGIAHLAGDGATTLTAPDQIIGSTRYLAPERARGGQAGKSADVYSLGCVLYELVTGQPPFTGEHPAAILYQQVDTQPAPPSATHPELAGAFETVLLRMLAKDPTDRPSAAEIASGALRALPDEARTTAVAPEVQSFAAPPGEVSGQTTAAFTPGGVSVDQPESIASAASAADRPRRQVLMAGGIAVVAAVAALAAVLLLNNGGPRLPSTNDVGPKPGISSSTPGATSATAPTFGQSPTSGTSQGTQSTSPKPSQSSSPQASTTPRTPSPSTGTPSPSPSAPSPSTPATRTTPSPTPSPSQPDPTSTPPPGTPSPNTQ